MSLPDLYKPNEIAERLGIAERRVRERARQLGTCLIMGNRMALTADDVLAIMESFRCRSRSSRGAKSTTTPGRLPVNGYAGLLALRAKKSHSKSPTAKKPEPGNVISMDLKRS